MKITINNSCHEIPDGITLYDITTERNLPDRGVAVAVNNEMVPRCEWNRHIVKDGDDIVILKAFNGG